MPRKLCSHVRTNLIGYLALFVALGGTGAYAALSSIPDSGGNFHGCVNTRTGALRVVESASRCHKSRIVRQGGKSVRRPGELAMEWNERGQRGDPGTPGGQGAKGDQGAQGPGATTFTATLASGAPPTTLATFANGIRVEGACPGGHPGVSVDTTSGLGNLEASGTGNQDSAITTIDTASADPGSGVGLQGMLTADMDVLARDETVGKFARIDIHGDAVGTPCNFWGMFIPSG